MCNTVTVIVTVNTHQEQEQQQHQQKQHGFCDCGRCSGAFDSCRTFDVALPLTASVVLDVPVSATPAPPPPPPTPPPLPAAEPVPMLPSLPFPLPLPLFCDVAVMPRKRQPLGSSETVQDMLDERETGREAYQKKKGKGKRKGSGKFDSCGARVR